VEAIVRSRGDGSELTGWRYESIGRTAEDVAEGLLLGY
jgi:hypothetical protein